MRARIVRMAVLMCLAALLLLGAETALAADNDSRVDAVIIIDVSTSMNQSEAARLENRAGSKIYDAAYDAATMFIQMCEMNGSRVAVVPFADGVYTTQESTGSYEWCTLRSISDLDTRNELVSAVRKLRSANNTDLGPAMQTAYELLAGSRDDAEANKPMILLLTDGSVGIFEGGYKQMDKTEASEKQAEEYARLSREAGINIYCIGLESENYNGDNLKTYTNNPEKVYKTTDVAELPRIFNEIFADQIGARVIEDIDWTENEDGTVTLDINIPNRSILEANVILSVEENAEQPEVYDPQGQYANNADNVTIFGGKSYQIVKIQNPAVGVYRITYRPENVGAIKVSLVANYKVQYQLESVTEAGKNSSVTIDGYFVENDQHSDDTALYVGNIQAMLEIYDASHTLVGGMPMETSESQDHFTCTLSLEGLKSGEYYIESAAEGDGLARSSQQGYVLTIINHAPVATAQIDAIALRINDVLSEDPNSAQQAGPIDLSAYFADSDGDALRYEVSGMGVTNAWIEAGQLYVASNGSAGSDELIVTAYDDENQSAQLTVSVGVTDVKAMLESGKLAVVEDMTARAQGKAQDVAVFMGVYGSDGQAMTDGTLMQSFAAGAELICQSTNGTSQEISVVYDEDTGCLKGFVSTETHSGDYVISGSVHVKEATVLLEEFTFSVSNAAPVAAVREQELKMYIEPLPIPVLNQPECADAVLNMADYFSDADAEPLSYACQYASLIDEDGNVLIEITENFEEDMLTFTALNDGELTLVVTAEDGDGKTAQMTLNVVIVSITDATIQLLIKAVLLLLAALIVIRLFYYLVLKPRYKMHMQLCITRADAYIDERRLPAGKKTLRLSAYRNAEAIEDTGIEGSMLANITIKPGRGGSLVVTNGKKNKPSGGKVLTVTVGGREVKPGKSERLYENGSITLQVSSRGDEGFEKDNVAWTYQRRQDD